MLRTPGASSRSSHRIPWTSTIETAGTRRGCSGLYSASRRPTLDYLACALREGLVTTPVRRVLANPPHGVVCGVWITIRGLGAHADRTAVVRTAWEIRHEDDAPRLVTAYIKA